MCKGGCAGNCGCNITRTTKGEKGDSGIPYLVYTALLTQSGTSAATATVLNNTIGTVGSPSPTITRSAAGKNIITWTGKFIVGKTTFSVGPVDDNACSSATTDASYNNVDRYSLYTIDNAGLYTDAGLTSTFFEIRVYP